MPFLKKKGQGFPLLSGLGATKHNKSCAGKTIKATLRLSVFARNLAKPSKTQQKQGKPRGRVLKRQRERKKNTRKHTVIRLLKNKPKILSKKY
ncbi:hypothetical protein B8T70_23190 [Flavobacterium sp. AJR]|nr:hypothetical protein B8T70_23190 [Flavobacterium sp. AJR]